MVTSTFLDGCWAVYHNPGTRDMFAEGGLEPHRVVLHTDDDGPLELGRYAIGTPYAELVRSGQVKAIDVFFE
jgi:hypothetical protein